MSFTNEVLSVRVLRRQLLHFRDKFPVNFSLLRRAIRAYKHPFILLIILQSFRCKEHMVHCKRILKRYLGWSYSPLPFLSSNSGYINFRPVSNLFEEFADFFICVSFSSSGKPNKMTLCVFMRVLLLSNYQLCLWPAFFSTFSLPELLGQLSFQNPFYLNSFRLESPYSS